MRTLRAPFRRLAAFAAAFLAAVHSGAHALSQPSCRSAAFVASAINASPELAPVLKMLSIYRC